MEQGCMCTTWMIVRYGTSKQRRRQRGAFARTQGRLQNHRRFLFTMVPEGRHVRSVYLDSHAGVLTTSVDDKILVDCSTIDTATSMDVGAAVCQNSKTAAFYDAPVSGGSLGAVAGTLTFMVGCVEDDPNLELLQALLRSMGASIFPCGGFLLGLTAKLCNNYCSGLIAIATAEAMNIGIKSGMKPSLLARVFATSTAQSTINDKWNPVPGCLSECPGEQGVPGWVQGAADEEGSGAGRRGRRPRWCSVTIGGASITGVSRGTRG